MLAIDAKATEHSLHRQGIGKLKHTDVAYLWVQDEIRSQRLRVRRVRSEENVADLGTKALSMCGPFEMATWDVSRAHFYSDARRWIYTHLPEGHEQEGKLARLCRSMYGTRDAASIWGDTWSDVLKESSLKVGTACTAFFCSRDGDFKGLCHGDDFSVVARQKQLQTFGKVLEKRFEETGHIGFGARDKKELKILNRTIKIDVLNDEMTLEVDTKLVEGSLESMKLNGAKGVDRHVSGELNSKQHRSRIPRKSRLRSRLCTAAW